MVNKQPAKFKKGSQDEQQTLITAKTWCSFEKRLIPKVKIASDKTETKHFLLH